MTVTFTLDNNSETIDTLFPVINFLKCAVIEVVLFSIVAFKTLDRCQLYEATHLRCGGIFSDSIITNFLLISLLAALAQW